MNLKLFSTLVRRQEIQPYTRNSCYQVNFYIVNTCKGTALEVRAVGDWFEAGKDLARTKDWLYDERYLFKLLLSSLPKASIALAYTKAISDFVLASRTEDDIHVLSYFEYRRSQHAWTLIGHASKSFYARFKAMRWNGSRRIPIKY